MRNNTQIMRKQNIQHILSFNQLKLKQEEKNRKTQ